MSILLERHNPVNQMMGEILLSQQWVTPSQLSEVLLRLNLVEQGKPPIVLLVFNNDLMQQHYVTITGYYYVTGKIFFHDSINGPYRQLDEEEFHEMWQNKNLRNLPQRRHEPKPATASERPCPPEAWA